MTTPFRQAPQQSQSLREDQENILPPPPNILAADLSNPATVGLKRRAAIEYELDTKRHRSATNVDVDNAVSHRIGAEVAALMPAIAANSKAFALEDIRKMMTELLKPIQETLTSVDKRLSGLETLLPDLDSRSTRLAFNSSACDPADMLVPPLMLNRGYPPIGAPTSVEQIERLQDGALLAALEAYYDLTADEQSLSERRKALRRAYGVSARTTL